MRFLPTLWMMTFPTPQQEPDADLLTQTLALKIAVEQMVDDSDFPYTEMVEALGDMTRSSWLLMQVTLPAQPGSSGCCATRGMR